MGTNGGSTGALPKDLEALMRLTCETILATDRAHAERIKGLEMELRQTFLMQADGLLFAEKRLSDASLGIAHALEHLAAEVARLAGEVAALKEQSVKRRPKK